MSFIKNKDASPIIKPNNIWFNIIPDNKGFKDFLNGIIALWENAVNDIVITIPKIKKAYLFKYVEYSGIKNPNNKARINNEFLFEIIFRIINFRKNKCTIIMLLQNQFIAVLV